MNALGRRTPSSWEHVDRYPLVAAPAKPVPVAIGINWYTAFDTPQRQGGAWWIGRGNDLGSVRGGHCVALLPAGLTDPASYWAFYDQGQEGACVGFGCSRMMSLLNRRRYDARWLWNQAKLVDEWPDTNPGDDNGTSVRAACDVLRAQGAERWHSTKPTAQDGISANRWATSVDQVLAALGTPDRDYVVVLNSWGRTGYPHFTRMPASVLDRLIREDGEATLVVDL